jgi:hypothetical protein
VQTFFLFVKDSAASSLVLVVEKRSYCYKKLKVVISGIGFD